MSVPEEPTIVRSQVLKTSPTLKASTVLRLIQYLAVVTDTRNVMVIAILLISIGCCIDHIRDDE